MRLHSVVAGSRGPRVRTDGGEGRGDAAAAVGPERGPADGGPRPACSEYSFGPRREARVPAGAFRGARPVAGVTQPRDVEIPAGRTATGRRAT